jgi:hypothetical protein
LDPSGQQASRGSASLAQELRRLIAAIDLLDGFDHEGQVGCEGAAAVVPERAALPWIAARAVAADARLDRGSTAVLSSDPHVPDGLHELREILVDDADPLAAETLRPQILLRDGAAGYAVHPRRRGIAGPGKALIEGLQRMTGIIGGWAILEALPGAAACLAVASRRGARGR